MAKLNFSIAMNLLTDNFKKGTNYVRSSLRAMQMQILTFAAAMGVGGLGLSGFVSRLIDVARESSRVTTALKNVSGGLDNYAANQRFVNEMAKKYGLEVLALTQNFAKFTASASVSGMAMSEQKKIFESVSRACTAFGMSADDSNGVFLALSQMMSKGKISSEELRLQMGERLPIALQAMAKAAGVTVGELDSLMKKGKLMSADILPRFADALSEMIPEVDTDNIETSVNRLKNAFTEFTMGTGVQEKYKSLIDNLTKIVEYGSKNIESIISKLVAALSATILAKFFNFLAKEYAKSQVIAMRAAAEIAKDNGIAFDKTAWRAKSASASISVMFKRMSASVKASLITMIPAAIAAGIAALGYAIYELWKGTDKLKATQESQANVARNTQTEYEQTESKVKALSSAIEDENLSNEQRRNLISELKNILPGYNGEIDKEGKLINHNTQELEKYLAVLKKQIQLKSLESEISSLYQQKNELQRESSEGDSAMKDFDEWYLKPAKWAADLGTKARHHQEQKKADSIDRTIKDREEEFNRLKIEQITSNPSTPYNLPDYSSGTDDSKKGKDNRLKHEKEFSDSVLDIQKMLTSQKIDLMKEGIEKEKALLAQQYKNELQSINELRDKVIKVYNEKNNLTGSKAVRSENYQEIPGLEDQVLSAQVNAQAKFAKSIIDLNKGAGKEIQMIREDMTSQFRTDLENRLIEIDHYYDEQIKKAREKGSNIEAEANAARLRAKGIAENESALRKNDFNLDLELSGLEVNTDGIGMTEYVEQRKTEILLKYSKERLSILEKMTDEQSVQESKMLKISITGYEKQLSKPKSINGTINQAVYNKVFDFFKKDNSVEDATEKTNKFFSSFKTGGDVAVDAIGMIQGAAGGMSEDMDIALNSVMNIAQGFAQGGIVGGIAAAASTALSLVTSAKKSEEAFRKAQQEFLLGQMQAQRELNSLLIEEIRLKKEGAEGIFYSSYSKDYLNAVQAQVSARKALDDLHKETREREINNIRESIGEDAKGMRRSDGYASAVNAEKDRRIAAILAMKDVEATLNSIQIKTGQHKEGGFLGIGKKTVDDFSSLSDYANLFAGRYKNLVDESGKLNTSIAQSILQNETLDEVGRATLEGMISYTEAYNESIKQMDEIISGIFGDIGNSLGDALIEAFKAGESGLAAFEKSFKDSMSRMLDSLVMNMIVDQVFGKMLDKYKEQTSSAMEITDPTKKQDELTRIMGDLVSDSTKAYGIAESAVKAYDNAKQTNGLSSFLESDETSGDENTLKGAYAKASQDSIDLLAGQTGAARIALESICSMLSGSFINSTGNVFSGVTASLEAIKDINSSGFKELTEQIKNLSKQYDEFLKKIDGFKDVPANVKKTADALSGTNDSGKLKVKIVSGI